MTSLRAARARFVRQPGHADLLWPRVDVPYADARYSAEERIYMTLEAETLPRLVALLRAARSRGLRVVLTFLSLGGAAGVDGLADPAGEYVTGSVPGMSFAGHYGHTVESDGRLYTLGAPAGRVRGGTRGPLSVEASVEFVESTLDPRDEYKRCFVRKIAYQTARMLYEALSQAGISDDEVGEVVEGIELLNELNTACTPVRPDHQAVVARDWGVLVAWAALGFFEWCNDNGKPWTFFRYWLPSMASPRAEQSVSAIGAFAKALDLAMLEELKARLGPMDYLSPFVNRDLHWYRFTGPQAPVPALQMVHLVYELESGAWLLWYMKGIGLGGSGMVPTVTICETGASVNQDEAEFPDEVVYLELQDSFQAKEVFRRLCCGAVSGAVAVGWHSHMGDPETKQPFAGTGLREDDNTITAANQSHERPSFRAFRQLVELSHRVGADGAPERGALAWLVSPSRDFHGDYDVEASSRDPLSTDEPADMVTIVGFLTADGHYAYALWIDSAASFSVGVEVRVRVDWAWSWRPPVAVEVMDTELTPVDGAEPADPAEFPTDRWLSGSSHLRVPTEVVLQVNFAPVVLRSWAELSFAVPRSSGASTARSGPPMRARLRRARS